MKILFASDIHGSAYYCRRLLDIYKETKASRMVIGKTFYATHGHVFNQDHLPPMQDGDILVHGHTHLPKAEKVETECGTITVLNPGSVSIPKGGNPNTYAILENGVFTIYSLDGEVVKELKL